MQKYIQRKVYDTVSSKNGILTVFVGFILLGCSAFYFGEAIVEWSSEKYAVVFNSFSDNLLGKSYRTRLCLPVPIDVVYTWVNGTDPAMLSELRRTKADLDEHTEANSTEAPNKSEDKGCHYANCVKQAMAIFPTSLPTDVTRESLERKSLHFQSLVRLETVSSDDLRANFTLAHFLTKEDVAQAVNKSVKIGGRSYRAVQAYYTSDVTIPKSKLQQTVLLISGFKKSYTSEEIGNLLPKHFMSQVFEVEMVGKVGVFKTSTSGAADTLLGLAYNFTLDGRYLQLNKANLVYDLTFNGGKELDLSASRFEDNEELRYSLRSLEQYAPWVRQIFIVTNGQIPYWLSLDNPRVTIVTHEEIFPNKSHLPTFSSPAIESHLHRIPGLSDKFLYLNDDVMFGAQVWPDDFYTHSKGQKVYLTWSIPDCAPGCPQTWIKDGYCDKACNVSECGWDAGDCAGGVAAFNGAANNWDNHHWMQRDESVMCETGCSNPWLADKYCDAACNVKSCGFDAGDCGVGSFHHLHSITMSRDVVSYTIPAAVTEAYLNFTSISPLKLTEASYEDHKSVRVVAASNKYRTLTVILMPKHNETTLRVNLTFGDGSEKYLFLFMIRIQKGVTALSTVANTTLSSGKPAKQEVVSEQPFVFENIPLDARAPEAAVQRDDGLHLQKSPSSDINIEQLPETARLELDGLRKQLLEGEITQKGFDIMKKRLFSSYPPSSRTPQNVSQADAQGRESHLPQPNREQLQHKPGNPAGIVDSVKNSLHNRDNMKHRMGDRRPQPNEQRGGRRVQVDQEGEEGKKADHQLQLEREEEKGIDGKGLREANGLAVDKDDYKMEHHNSRQLQEYVEQDQEIGFLPWEKAAEFKLDVKKRSARHRAEEFTDIRRGRQLLDTFGQSLHHVNDLYNKMFGVKARKVPGHIPHMIDKEVMTDLHYTFKEQWDATSSHKIRSGNDMQYAFSYFYFLMDSKRNNTATDFIEEMDIDNSGVLSDREIRTMATRIFDSPLDLQSLTSLEQYITNCSQHMPVAEQKKGLKTNLLPERYYDKGMPQVTLPLLRNCGPVLDLITKKVQPKAKYRYELLGDEDIHFKMIGTNLSSVVGQLDDLRRHPRKFICLNDNIDHSNSEAMQVKALLADFYESLFPIRSQFELPADYRNRFLHADQLREWQKTRDYMKIVIEVLLVCLVLYTIYSFYEDQIKLRREQRRRPASENV
ncbi:N-acetylglucosamine-1-phosphotransferase subunits alpha/beta-like [Watersipora subatra]|uniref:N-acetylglucosamine-1-phosphotransferase subunits alpha/beta-like n=1 Tax=Watersipora subatra TaxID=2589382 RepID=UPI00355C7F2A